MICVDSDVFLIDLRYPTDRRARENGRFLEALARSARGATTIFNLLEVTGILSFNLPERRLVDFYAHFPRRYNVQVLPYHDPGQLLPAVRLGEILRAMGRRASFGDALIAVFVNRLHPDLDAFVTWNQAHFQGRLAAPVFTPKTFPWQQS